MEHHRVGKHYTGTVKSSVRSLWTSAAWIWAWSTSPSCPGSHQEPRRDLQGWRHHGCVRHLLRTLEKHKISLGAKDHSVDPWQVFMNKYGVGDTAEVRIVAGCPFGAAWWFPA